jgi:hypothetical protein
VCTYVVWYKVFHNYALYKLALNGNGPLAGGNWIARPSNPMVYSTAARGYNEYITYSGDICAGQMFMVEIDDGELDLLLAITYLLGASNCIKFDWGEYGGSDMVPHLAAKTPARFNYGILIRDELTPPVAYPVQSYPGLAVGALLGAAALVAPLPFGHLECAIDVIARGAPCKSDIHAAAIKVAVDSRAEPLEVWGRIWIVA